MFGFSREALEKAVANRVGQCIMTCPSTAVYDGLEDGENRIALGQAPPFLWRRLPEEQADRRETLLADPGDGRRVSRAGVRWGRQRRRRWQHHPPDGGTSGRVGGGAASRRGGGGVDGAITPFPGGVARSGSKVGSRYKGLIASTSDPFCPTLRGRVESQLHPDANCAYEIVIDGVSPRRYPKPWPPRCKRRRARMC
jgi:formylmethanofuran--tetrahydromethanopterin N-formyltransferase